MIPDAIKETFSRLTNRHLHSDIADVVLTECTTADTNEPVWTACVVVRHADGGVEAVPVAVMVDPIVLRGRLIPPTSNQISAT